MIRSIEEMNKDIGSATINIKSIQAASVYRDNNNHKFIYKQKNGERIYIDDRLKCGNAVISDSIFARFARKYITVTKRDNSKDFVMIKFDYGVDTDDSDPDNIKEGISANELRKIYYNDGVTINWRQYDKEGNEIVGKRNSITYKMLYRSTGKAKEGHCVFCRKEIHLKMIKYLTMELWDKMPEDQNAKIVELSAYSPLITATASAYIHIPLENIFIVKDEEVSCYKNSHVVEYNGSCYVKRNQQNTKITNTLWDGMGICSEELFPEDMEGFIYCRSHFFKSCLFRGNIQQYFKDKYKDDYDTAYAVDMIGRRIKISDIKVIVTDNSLKWMKFTDLMSEDGTLQNAFNYYDKIMKQDGEIFEIVKSAHSSKYGNWQRSSFQINNTLLTTDKNVLQKVVQNSIDYCNRLKLDDEAYLEYLRVTGSASYSINNVIISLYQQNSDVKYWDWFKDLRTDKISDFKRNRLQQGKLLQEGDNLTICGNVIALLEKVIGLEREEFLNEGCFRVEPDVIQCYTERFAEGEEIAGFRSPHNSPNNIICLKNIYPELLRKYFPKLGKNVIVINGIGTDVQERLNSQDLDSDTIYATNQADIVELAKKAYVDFPTIKNAIPPKTKGYINNMDSYAEMDSAISSSQQDIGTSSNIAQLALSYWFDGGCSDEELEDIFVICSVLAQIAIDSAKRTFDAKPQIEISKIIRKSCMNIHPKYPVFYAEIQKYKNRKKKGKKKVIKKEEIAKFNCPMDIMYGLIETGVIDLRQHKELNTKTIKNNSVFLNCSGDHKKTNRSQLNKIKGIVKEYNDNINALDDDAEDFYDSRKNEFDACQRKLRNLTIKKDTMKRAVKYAFESGNEDIRNILLVTLYEKDKNTFLECFNKKDNADTSKI